MEILEENKKCVKKEEARFLLELKINSNKNKIENTKRIINSFENFSKKKIKLISKERKELIISKKELEDSFLKKNLIINFQKIQNFELYQKLEIFKNKKKTAKVNNSEKCDFCNNYLSEVYLSKKSVVRVRENFYHDKCFLKLKKKISL
jgi:hypothetical protein